MSDVASLLLAIAAVISALGGSVAGVIAAIRNNQRQRHSAAENAVSIATRPKAKKHRLESGSKRDGLKDMIELLRALEDLEDETEDADSSGTDDDATDDRAQG